MSGQPSNAVADKWNHGAEWR